VKCSVWKFADDRGADAVDFAQETITEKGINSTSALENCVTSATGRCLSLLGGQLSPSKKRASRTEMEKVSRVSAARLWANAQTAFDKGNIDELRELYTESKESGIDAETIAKILDLGGSLAQKLRNAPDEKDLTI
jgi:hypothetical protein